jgi:hypothetical protein
MMEAAGIEPAFGLHHVERSPSIDISPSVFEAAWIDPSSVVDLPPGGPFQFSISVLAGEQRCGNRVACVI